ncbi:MAG: GAF domain-containing sensor histidine kinase [Anaerolineales bacterium]|nr:MAG: GAF domain-containing sensor histidine kinase [Anaerolineales bacterium]
MSIPANPHEEPGMSPVEFIRLQDELRKRNEELAAVNAALRESEGRLEQRVEERTRELSILLRLSHNITTTLKLEPLLGLILAELKEVVGYRLASISILEKENELLLLAARGKGMPQPGTRSPLNEHSNTMEVLRKRESASVPDLKADTPLAGRMRNNLAAQNLTGLGSWMSAPLVIRDQSIGLLALAHPDVNYYNPARVELAMAFADQAAVAIENARLFATEQRRAEQFRVITEVGKRVTSILSLNQLLVETARTIRESFGYHHVHIGMVEGERVVFKTRNAAQPEDEMFQCCEDATPIVGRQGISGWVAGTGESLIVPDVMKDVRFIPSKNDQTRSETAIPIKIKGRVIGVIDVESNRLNGFDESDLVVLQSLADQVAVAIENARLYEQAQHLAALEERQKLARELHDSVSQALYGIVLGARTARTLLDRDAPKAAEPMDYILSLAEVGLAEMRALIFELRPESLQTEGLVAALGKLVTALGARFQLKVQLEAGPEPDVPIEMKESIYRITQEALNNIAKHAQAQHVNVSLKTEIDGLALNVSDDGAGFDTSQQFPGHLGLHTMRERAEKAGGAFALDSTPNAGTRIQVRIPMAAR